MLSLKTKVIFIEMEVSSENMGLQLEKLSNLQDL